LWHDPQAEENLVLVDAFERPFDPVGATRKDFFRFLITFDSYSRTEAMVTAMLYSPPRLRLQIFLDAGNDCDAPWPWRSMIASLLRRALTEVNLVDCLEPAERAYYIALPELVPVWRGCERGRERGISWTTDRAVAEKFATGKRCLNREPTLVRAEIPKPHVFGIFLDRKESEIALDYRRLRKLSVDNT
jgi:hypothetical protein